MALESGRYRGIPVPERVCLHCTNKVESECHVLTECSLYDDLRFELCLKACDVIPQFQNYNDNEKCNLILSHPLLVRDAAKICNDILERRTQFVYISNL